MRRWIKDPFPGLSHFFGAALSVIALIVLLHESLGNLRWMIAFAIYGGSLITLYLASGLCHSVYCSPGTEKWLDRFDYMAIFLLIAGTYTPVCLIALRGPWGWGILTAEWLMAALGISMVLSGRGLTKAMRAALYVVMGWLAIIAASPVLSTFSRPELLWLLGGGLIYSIGAIVFVLDRPHLWPGRFRAHDLWHCMVLAGSACHFILMLSIISRTVLVRP